MEAAAHAVHQEAAVKERRKYPRIKAEIPIEFTPENASSAIHTHTADISCGGCYVEMNFTLPVGTNLNMVLWLGDHRLASRAVVVTHHPYFGNGIQFVGMPVEDFNRLNRFLNTAVR